MRGFAVAKRYSEALWSLAGKTATAEAWLKPLEAFSKVLESSDELRRLMTSPLFPLSKKQAVLNDILAKIDGAQPVSPFLSRMLQAGRMNVFGPTLQAFRQRVLTAQGTIEILIESALPLTDAQKTELASHFGRMTGKTVSLISKLAPELLSGMRVSFGGKTIDGSLRTHLANLEKHLLKEDFGTHATA